MGYVRLCDKTSLYTKTSFKFFANLCAKITEKIPNTMIKLHYKELSEDNVK